MLKRIFTVGLGVLLVAALVAGANVKPAKIQANGLPEVFLTLDADASTPEIEITKSAQLTGGTIGHFDGSWSYGAPPVHLNDVWGTSNTDVFAVGFGGKIMHKDGTGWNPMDSGTSAHLYGVWGASGTDVFAVGSEGTILHYNGSWSSVNIGGETRNLNAVWGTSGTDVYAAGAGGLVTHYNGSWTTVSWGSYPIGDLTNDMYGIWGSAANDVMVVGSAGKIVRWDGADWKAMTSGTAKLLNAVSGIGPALVVEDGEDAWDEPPGPAPGVTSATGTGTFKKVGNASAKLTVDAAVPADTKLATEAIASTNLSTYPSVSLWIRSSVTTAAGDLQLLLGNTARCSPPLEVLDMPALTANQWKRVVLPLANPGGDTAIISIGLKQVTDIGAVTIYLDDVAAGEVLAVGNDGTIVRRDGTGTTWSAMSSDTTNSLYGVWDKFGSGVFTVGVGSGTFAVKVLARLGTLTASGAEAYVKYDPGVLQVVSVDQTNKPSEWSFLALYDIQNAGTDGARTWGWNGGYVKLTAAGTPPGALISGDRELGTIIFSAVGMSAGATVDFFHNVASGTFLSKIKVQIQSGNITYTGTTATTFTGIPPSGAGSITANHGIGETVGGSGAYTQLTAAAAIGATSITVTSTTGFPASGNIGIGTESTYPELVEATHYNITRQGFTAEVSTLPVVSITTPATDTTITAGQTISFVGSLVSGGPVLDANYKWDFDYHVGDTDFQATGLTPAAYGWSNIAGIYVVRFTGTNSVGTGEATRTITVQPGVAVYLTVRYGVLSSATIDAGGTVELTIRAYDANDNLCSSGTNEYKDPHDLTFGGPAASPDGNPPQVEDVNVGTPVSVSFSGGVSAANAATLEAYKAQGVTVNVSAGGIDSTVAGRGLNLTVNAGTASKLFYQQQPAPHVPGATVDEPLETQPIVEIRDAYGNLRTGDTTTVTLLPYLTNNTTPAAGALRNASIPAVGGVATFATVGYDRTDTIHIKATTATGLTPANGTVDITLYPGWATHLKVTGPGGNSATMEAGGPLELTVKAYDQFDNLCDSGPVAYAGSMNLTFSGPLPAPDGTPPRVAGVNVGSPVSVNFTAGVSDDYAATLTAYNAQVTAPAVDVSNPAGPAGDIDSFGNTAWDLDLTVNATSADHLAFAPEPSTPVVAGVLWTPFAVNILDEFDNLTTSDAFVVVSASVGDFTGDSSKTMAASAGTALFDNLKYTTATTINVTATVAAIPNPTVTKTGIVVYPAPAHHLTVTTQTGSLSSATVAANESLKLRVKAFDEFGNLCDSGTNIYQGSKQLDFSGPEASPAPASTQPTVNGVNVVGTAKVTVTFASGVSPADGLTLIAYNAQTTSPAVDVADDSTPSIDSFGDIAWDLDLTVDPASLDHVDITPPNPTVVTTDTVDFDAAAKDLYGNTMSATFTWSRTDANAGDIDAGTGVFTAGTQFATFTNVIQAETTVNLVTRTGQTSVTVEGATLRISAALQGDGRPLAGYTVPLTLKVYDVPITGANLTSETPVVPALTSGAGITIVQVPTQAEIDAKTNKTIVFDVTGLPVGTLNLTLYTPNCLVKYKAGVTINIDNTGVTVSMGVLREGDAVDVTATPASLIINIDDFTIFATAYETHGVILPTYPAASTNWDVNADFDRDSWITIADFSLLYLNYGRTSPNST